MMKAARLEEIQKIRITNVAQPECRKGDVLVKVMACGICRTDLKAYQIGQRDLHLPRVLGHEITGVVAETGREVTCVKPGDRVQVAPGLPCGTCRFCQMGMHHLCDDIKIMGFHYDGGFAEYVLVPENGVKNGVLNKIPETLTFYEAALTEPLACCVNMQESAGIGLGDQVVIFGAGPLGILNAKLARKRGAGRIILVEKREERIEAAKNDFDEWINPTGENAVSRILTLTEGKGADLAIPCCPDPQTMADSLNVLGKRGRFCFFSGMVLSESVPAIDLNLIHYKELFVYGAYGCSSLHNREALDLLAAGMIKVNDMTTCALPLSDLVQGIEKVAKREDTNTIIDLTL
ncbi:Sorbitol dehydrogenase [Dehalobacter sp. DCA]|jgi:Threonine dehydrogenase and related Zn-dependent dehydrogenases|uniref:zinc-dependent dehydrogenase n=1 Tax=Dehalobacter sp. DCA TaxID=1147129 RepID=UPI00028A81AC|nr:zinc-dependent dehydrogenase [Dehalobacter sp. DCA]AFV02145.1 Sorbitol dehydrogenase [Dehalobacter sp. DCA]